VAVPPQRRNAKPGFIIGKGKSRKGNLYIKWLRHLCDRLKKLEWDSECHADLHGLFEVLAGIVQPAHDGTDGAAEDAGYLAVGEILHTVKEEHCAVLGREFVDELKYLAAQLAASVIFEWRGGGLFDSATVFYILVVREFWPAFLSYTVNAVVDSDTINPGAVVACVVEGVERAVGFYKNLLHEVEGILSAKSIAAGDVKDAVMVGVEKLVEEAVFVFFAVRNGRAASGFAGGRFFDSGVSNFHFDSLQMSGRHISNTYAIGSLPTGKFLREIINSLLIKELCHAKII
jgi:hypothetical protein